jgi:hypothetical protein
MKQLSRAPDPAVHGDYLLMEAGDDPTRRTDVTKNWWESKINWVSVLGVAAQIANYMGWIVPPDLVEQTAVLLGAAQTVLTVIMRTWFTTVPVVNAVKP